MQKLGQHFLKNALVIEKIIGEVGVIKNDRIIEIGPGHGELTIPLLHVLEKTGGTLVSIEKDHALAAVIKINESIKNADGNFSVVEGDALKLLPSVVSSLHDLKGSSHGPYKIVGNIPYYITGKLLRVISELPQKPKRTVLMIQKEVAERICAGSPEMNRLAASVQFWADARIVAIVPKKDFSPAPEVDSAVILLEAKALPMDSGTYYRAVRGIFAQPRKTLLNNILAMANEKQEKAELFARIKKIGIDPEVRPQDLSIEQIVSIAKASPWG